MSAYQLPPTYDFAPSVSDESSSAAANDLSSDSNQVNSQDNWKRSPLVKTTFEKSEYDQKWPGDPTNVENEDEEDEDDDDGFIVKSEISNDEAEPAWSQYLTQQDYSSEENQGSGVWNVNQMFRFGFRVGTPTDDEEELSLLDKDARSLIEQSSGLISSELTSMRITELLKRFLLLEAPRITEQMLDFFLLDHVLEILMRFVTRIDPKLTKEPLNPAHCCSPENLLLCSSRKREQEEDQPQRLSYQVSQLFSSTSSQTSRLIDHKIREVVLQLFFIFNPKSDGNFYHFCKLIITLIQQSPTPVLDLLINPISVKRTHLEAHRGTTDSGFVLQKPLIFLCLPFINETPIQEALLYILIPKNSNDSSIAVQRSRLATLQQEEFFEELLSIVMVDKNQDSLTRQIVGAAEFIFRWIEEACDVDGGDIPFKTLEGDRLWVDKLVNCILSTKHVHQRDAAIEILHGISVRAYRRPLKMPIVSMEDLTRNTVKLPPPRSELYYIARSSCRYLINDLDKLSSLISDDQNKEDTTELKLAGHIVTKPFQVWRIYILEIIHEVLDVLLDSEDFEDSFKDEVMESLDPQFWCTLTNWFFQYSHNNTYHSIYYKLTRLAFHSHNEKSLNIILKDCNLIHRMVQEYRNSSNKAVASRGHIVLIFNVIRLLGEFLEQTDYIPTFLKNSKEWISFWPTLKEETLKQVVSTIPLSIPGQRVPPTPHFAPDVIQLDSPEGEPTNGTLSPRRPSSANLLEGVHLGSTYALALGFPEAVPGHSSANSPMASLDNLKRESMTPTVENKVYHEVVRVINSPTDDGPPMAALLNRRPTTFQKTGKKNSGSGGLKAKKKKKKKQKKMNLQKRPDDENGSSSSESENSGSESSIDEDSTESNE